MEYGKNYTELVSWTPEKRVAFDFRAGTVLASDFGGIQNHVVWLVEHGQLEIAQNAQIYVIGMKIPRKNVRFPARGITHEFLSVFFPGV